MRLRAEIERTGRTSAGIVVPDELVTALGASRHPRVRVTLGGYTFRSSIGVMGGRFLLPMTAETRERAGVAAGDAVELEIELDDEPREVEVPADLAAALERDDAARLRFALDRDHDAAPAAVGQRLAKTAETRQRRIAQSVAALHEGRA